MVKPLTPGQVRAGRALLRWQQKDLARGSGVPLQTLKAFELKPDQAQLAPDNDEAVRAALEAADVRLIGADARGGAGVRFAAPPAIRERLKRGRRKQ